MHAGTTKIILVLVTHLLPTQILNYPSTSNPIWCTHFIFPHSPSYPSSLKHVTYRLAALPPQPTPIIHIIFLHTQASYDHHMYHSTLHPHPRCCVLLPFLL